MINRFFNHFVSCFGYSCTNEFNDSIVHANMLTLTIPVAMISSFIETVMGLHGLTVLAFVVLVMLELITGIAASKSRGEKIVSHKFSRFGLKVFVWISLLFITNSLQLEYVGHNDLMSKLTGGFFSWLHGSLFVYITLEYLISVLENLGSLTNEKSKKTLINSIINKLNSFLGIEKNEKKTDENN